MFTFRQELENSRKFLSGSSDSRVHPIPPVPSPSQQQLPLLLTPSSRVPPLTSELLHVEECLQSRVKVLEVEKKDASLNILQLEKTLLEQKKEFHKEKESLFEQHRDAICKVSS